MVPRLVGEVRSFVTIEVPSMRRVRRQDFAFKPGIDVTDIAQVKGLEFDHVVIPDADGPAYPDEPAARAEPAL